MKKSILFLFFFTFIATQTFAQKNVTFGQFSKKFDKKYHYLDLPSWNTFGEKDTYLPLFIETYYEVTKTEVIEYALWYSDSKNVYNSKNIDKMTYTEKMLSSIFITKYPLAIFDTAEATFTTQKDENDGWKTFFEDGSDEGGKKINQKFKKPYYQVPFKLKQGKKYAYTQYNPKGKPEIEMKDTNEFTQYFNFTDEMEATIFAATLKAALNK